MIRKYKFPVINISQFYSRPGTVAAKWKKVESKEVKRRSTAVNKLFLSYSNYDHLKGTIQRVWIHDLKDEGRSPDESMMVAHTKSYAKVLIKRDSELIGKQVIVKIVEIHKWHVYGEIVDKYPKPVHVNFEDHFKGMYKASTTNTANNKMAIIKKEQEDIHATIIEHDKKIITTNCKNSSKPYSYLSITLYVLSLYFLHLGLNRINSITKY